ncbi:hypothetical protein M422DRAFT_43370 [Sphaerobolus stellatus SS14]|nr:hypothetical protein M422DRAFT_43370 [Sphaerobolus stellatus SS14]
MSSGIVLLPIGPRAETQTQRPRTAPSPAATTNTSPARPQLPKINVDQLKKSPARRTAGIALHARDSVTVRKRTLSAGGMSARATRQAARKAAAERRALDASPQLIETGSRRSLSPATRTDSHPNRSQTHSRTPSSPSSSASITPITPATLPLSGAPTSYQTRAQTQTHVAQNSQGTNTSAYPPSSPSSRNPSPISSRSPTPSPLPPPAAPTKHMHTSLDLDTDDVNARLRLLVNNSYFLPPAHTKPEIAPIYLAPNSHTNSSRPLSPSAFKEFFRRKKPTSPNSPSRPNTAGSSASAPTSPPLETYFDLPLAPDTPSRNRVVVVRETVDDLPLPSTHFTPRPPYRSSSLPSHLGGGGSAGPNKYKSTLPHAVFEDAFIDPTTQYDIPPPTHYPSFQRLGIDAAGLNGGSFHLDQFVPDGSPWSPGPSTPGLSVGEKEKEREKVWRMAILEQAVDLSLSEGGERSGVESPLASPRSPRSPGNILSESLRVDQTNTNPRLSVGADSAGGSHNRSTTMGTVEMTFATRASVSMSMMSGDEDFKSVRSVKSNGSGGSSGSGGKKGWWKGKSKAGEETTAAGGTTTAARQQHLPIGQSILPNMHLYASEESESSTPTSPNPTLDRNGNITQSTGIASPSNTNITSTPQPTTQGPNPPPPNPKSSLRLKPFASSIALPVIPISGPSSNPGTPLYASLPGSSGPGTPLQLVYPSEAATPMTPLRPRPGGMVRRDSSAGGKDAKERSTFNANSGGNGAARETSSSSSGANLREEGSGSGIGGTIKEFLEPGQSTIKKTLSAPLLSDLHEVGVEVEAEHELELSPPQHPHPRPERYEDEEEDTQTPIDARGRRPLTHVDPHDSEAASMSMDSVLAPSLILHDPDGVRSTPSATESFITIEQDDEQEQEHEEHSDHEGHGGRAHRMRDISLSMGSEPSHPHSAHGSYNFGSSGAWYDDGLSQSMSRSASRQSQFTLGSEAGGVSVIARPGRASSTFGVRPEGVHEGRDGSILGGVERSFGGSVLGGERGGRAGSFVSAREGSFVSANRDGDDDGEQEDGVAEDIEVDISGDVLAHLLGMRRGQKERDEGDGMDMDMDMDGESTRSGTPDTVDGGRASRGGGMDGFSALGPVGGAGVGVEGSGANQEDEPSIYEEEEEEEEETSVYGTASGSFNGSGSQSYLSSRSRMRTGSDASSVPPVPPIPHSPHSSTFAPSRQSHSPRSSSLPQPSSPAPTHPHSSPRSPQIPPRSPLRPFPSLASPQVRPAADPPAPIEFFDSLQDEAFFGGVSDDDEEESDEEDDGEDGEEDARGDETFYGSGGGHHDHVNPPRPYQSSAAHVNVNPNVTAHPVHPHQSTHTQAPLPQHPLPLARSSLHTPRPTLQTQFPNASQPAIIPSGKTPGLGAGIGNIPPSPAGGAGSSGGGILSQLKSSKASNKGFGVGAGVGYTVSSAATSSSDLGHGGGGSSHGHGESYGHGSNPPSAYAQHPLHRTISGSPSQTSLGLDTRPPSFDINSKHSPSSVDTEQQKEMRDREREKLDGLVQQHLEAEKDRIRQIAVAVSKGGGRGGDKNVNKGVGVASGSGGTGMGVGSLREKGGVDRAPLGERDSRDKGRKK